MDTIKGYFNDYKIELEVKKLPTDIYGLKYLPSIEPIWRDDRDYYIEWGSKNYITAEIEKVDREYITDFLNKYRNNFRTIVEIGVCRKNLETSWTKYFIELKNSNCYYLGVDANDKSFLNNSSKNIYTIKAWSSEMDRVLEYIEKITGKKEIDLFFIDANHSIRNASEDFRYAKYLSKKGIVLFHDISVHPAGLVFDAVDEEIFEKEKIFLHHPMSSGIGVAYKK